MSLRDFFGSLIAGLKESAQVKTVFGEPIRIDNRTIIPVAKAGFGFGSLPVRGAASDTESPPDGGTRAGGAAATSPLGVLDISPEGTQFVAIPDNNPAKVVAAFAVGLILGALLAARGRRNRPELSD